MADTNLDYCEICDEQYDRLIGTGERNICDECKEKEGEE